MAFTASPFGYTFTTVVDPSPAVTYSAGPFGYTSSGTLLADPTPPPATKVPGPWGTLSVKVERPHKPIGVKVTGGTPVKYAPIKSFNGTVWR